jgi:hypothetical protein
MAKPKNPQPNHPFHDAASAIEQEIESHAAPLAPGDHPAPVAPVPPVTPEPHVPTPLPASTPAQPQPEKLPAEVETAMARMQGYVDTMMGRVEKLNTDLTDERTRNATLAANVDFVTQRANEKNAEYERVIARNRELEQALEVNDAARGFSSDLVDKDQFAEIFRGLAPHLKRRDELIDSLNQRNAALEKRLDDVASAVPAEVAKLDQKWVDRQVLRSTPEITSMLQSPAGKDFLAQRIPGSRRTRMQELQDAYRDGDDEFIKGLVADWKRVGAPVEVPNADPPRTILNEVPRPAVPEQPISDEQVSAAFQDVLAGRMTRKQFTAITAAQAKQVANGMGR